MIMKLYLGNLNYSSWSIRALLVAKMANVDFEYDVLKLLDEGTREKVSAATGHHLVPALVDGAISVRDSLAITEYIAENADAGKVWPVASSDRAFARTVVAEMHSGFFALRKQCYVDIRARRPETVLTPETKADVARVISIWAQCRKKRTKAGPYLFGDWSAADAFYAPVVTRFRTYGIELEGDDAVYSESVLTHPDMVEIEQAALNEKWVLGADDNGMFQLPDLP